MNSKTIIKYMELCNRSGYILGVSKCNDIFEITLFGDRPELNLIKECHNEDEIIETIRLVITEMRDVYLNEVTDLNNILKENIIA